MDSGDEMSLFEMLVNYMSSYIHCYLFPAPHSPTFFFIEPLYPCWHFCLHFEQA